MTFILKQDEAASPVLDLWVPRPCRDFKIEHHLQLDTSKSWTRPTGRKNLAGTPKTARLSV